LTSCNRADNIPSVDPVYNPSSDYSHLRRSDSSLIRKAGMSGLAVLLLAVLGGGIYWFTRPPLQVTEVLGVAAPTPQPSATPEPIPTITSTPTRKPTAKPSAKPTVKPTAKPSGATSTPAATATPAVTPTSSPTPTP